MTLTLRTVTRTQGNNRDLKSGAVEPDGVRFDFEEVPVLVQAFRRMVRESAYDISEMALTTYLCARAHGVPITAVPVFLVRGFHHGAVLRAAGSATTPGDLEGARVGVNRGYTVTTGVWARGVLQDEHGVRLDRVTWAPSGDEHVQAYVPPANVQPLGTGADLLDLVRTGELPAAVGLDVGEGTEPMVADAEEAGFAALRDRGHYPINHLVVVRDELLAEQPGLAAVVFDAFARSKAAYVDRLRAQDPGDDDATDRMHRRVMDLTGNDPLPYGLEPNRVVLDELVRHAVTQAILPGPVALEDVFAAGTHDLVG
jgi:4,5-dihydroxyphthalate decarboxylase